MNAFTHFVVNEWYFAIPMFVMSLVAIALVVWRWLLNLSAKTDMDSFLPVFQEKLQKEGVQGALRLCREESGMIPRKLFASGLEASKQGISAMKRAMASTLELEILPDLNFLLAFILAIAKIATMVGLLGTVISMIGTFTAISNVKGGGNPTDVTTQAGSIGLALFATALGLMTAIPLVFTHVLFKDWIFRFEAQMKSHAQRLIVLFQNMKPKQGTEIRDPKDRERERVKSV
jgi:biopolymer transport protein ExbB